MVAIFKHCDFLYCHKTIIIIALQSSQNLNNTFKPEKLNLKNKLHTYWPFLSQNYRTRFKSKLFSQLQLHILKYEIYREKVVELCF